MFSLSKYDPHVDSHHSATAPQIAILLVWICSMLLWLVQLIRPTRSPLSEDANGDAEIGRRSSVDGDIKDNSVEQNGGNNVSDVTSSTDTAPAQKQTTTGSNGASSKQFSRPPPQPTYAQFLLYLMALGTILLYFYLCDYYKVCPPHSSIIWVL